ncbi:MAG: folylpolyglutamate synthase [Faecalibacterium sp.]
MTIEQADRFFASLPDGFADTDALRASLPESAKQVQYIGIAGTAGKTAVAALLAAILRRAGFRIGLYCAGCEPLSARIRVDEAPADPDIYSVAAEALAGTELPFGAAELAVAAACFGAAGCALAVVELPDAGLAAALPQLPVCAVTAIGPDGVSRSVERLAALAGGVMREGSVCVIAPEQPKAVLSELIVAAGKCGCELVVPDAEDIRFLEAEKFSSRVDYGGYTASLGFLGRHAAGNAAIAVELALALWRKGFEIPDEAILEGLAAVHNRSSIRVLSQRPLVILDACRTPQQAAALLRVLNLAKVRHMSAIIGLAEEEGAEAFFAALESGLTPEEQKKDKQTMPGMGENPFDQVYLVTPQGADPALMPRLREKARFHFDVECCKDMAQAVELARVNARRGLLVCGSEAAALEAAHLLEHKFD